MHACTNWEWTPLRHQTEQSLLFKFMWKFLFEDVRLICFGFLSAMTNKRYWWEWERGSDGMIRQVLQEVYEKSYCGFNEGVVPDFLNGWIDLQ